LNKQIENKYILERNVLQISIFLLIVSFVLTSSVRLFAPIAYDLIFYEQYYNFDIDALEPLFKITFRFLHFIKIPFKLATLFVPVVVFTIIYYKSKVSLRSYLFLILLILGSQFFTLGILNGLRQFYATLFILIYFLSTFLRISNKFTFILFLISIGFHWSSIFIFPLVIIMKYISSHEKYNRLMLLFICSIIIVFFLFSNLVLETKYLREFEDGRSSTITKYAFFALYFLLTSYLTLTLDLVFYKRFRLFFFIFLSLTVFYGELFSRILFLYSAFEVVYFYASFMSTPHNYVKKFFYLLLFIFYNLISLNVLNILWFKL
jgi:hypothetical protein